MATILCIDREPAILFNDKSLLEKNGHAVLTAADSASGIALSRDHHPDAVVVDYQMPDMNGEQIAQLLLQEKPDLPVVIRSSSPDSVPEGLRWCVEACLHKADDPGILLATLERLVKSKPAKSAVTSRPVYGQGLSA